MSTPEQPTQTNLTSEWRGMNPSDRAGYVLALALLCHIEIAARDDAQVMRWVRQSMAIAIECSGQRERP